jgi:hypothetical protein
MSKIEKVLSLYQVELNSKTFNRDVKLSYRDCSLRFTSHDPEHDNEDVAQENYEIEFIDNSVGNVSVFKLFIDENFDFVRGEYSGENMDEEDFLFQTDEYFDLIIQEFDGL